MEYGRARFPCLSRGLLLKLITCTVVVSACTVLHNLSLHFKDVLPEEPDQPNEIENNEELYYIMNLNLEMVLL